MQHAKSRLMIGLLLPLALSGALAGCGDEEPKSGGNAPATSAKPAGTAAEVDQAFVRQMIPHHQMAVQMAAMAKTNGEHAEIKQLADDIIASQSEEIDALKRVARELDVTPDGPMAGGATGGRTMRADATTLGLTMDEMGMSMDMGSLHGADPFDQAFIVGMTPHHEGAIAMAKAQLAGGEHAALKELSTAIISAQQKEIAAMADWHEQWYGKAPADAPAGGHMHSGH